MLPLLALLLSACTPSESVVVDCPLTPLTEVHPERGPEARYIAAIPTDADPVAYQCTADLLDCIAAPIDLDSRGLWYAACPEDDTLRPVLLVEWVVL